MSLSRAWCIFLLSLLGLTVLAQRQPSARPVVLGLLSVDAEKYNVEFQQFDRMIPVYKTNGIAPAMVELMWFLHGMPNADALYQRLKPFHAIVLSTTTEANETVQLTPAQAAYGKLVGEALLRYVHEGGGLFIQAQAVRYPNTDDEKYWNVVLAPFGVEILHEGCFDTTRAMEGIDLYKTQYWFTQRILPHPVTQEVQRLYLPIHGPGAWPGIPALKYTPDWQVIVTGEAQARSYRSDHENVLRVGQEGSYASAPPVVAVRTIGKGRVISFPLSPIHSGMNYNNPLWRNTVETEGDKGANLPSHTLRLLMNAYRWVGETARENAELGDYPFTTYTPVQYPASIDWDKYQFSKPNNAAYPDGTPISFLLASDGVRGIVGARSNYGGGKGTVADYVQAAKAAGLSFLVFTDPLEQLTPATLAALKRDCADASKAGEFYACPGVEFTDGIGCRWAFWGEKVVFPAAECDSYGKKYPLWDPERKIVRHYGAYSANCAFPPSALLDYKQLAANGAHPENLWWFYHYAPFVYEKDKLIADNYGEYLRGLSDMRWSALTSYTRVGSPADVAAAAKACVTGCANLAAAKAAMNTRCAAYWQALSSRQYVTQGPTIATWDVINPQMESNWKYTRGAQRVRLQFIVRSPIGIAEVRVHDGARGVIRRFAGGGAKELAREFEMVQDQQHYVTLEVLDTAGKRAISWNHVIYCYKQGLFRCADNLNILGATGLVWHPDRNEALTAAKGWENGMDASVYGWDTSGYLCPMPQASLLDWIRISDKPDLWPLSWQDGVVGKILDVPLSSYNIQIASQKMTMLSERYDSPTRPTPAIASPPKDLGTLEFFERTRTIYAPMTRTDWFTAWNYRRAREGARDYRGGLIWHEGEVRFTKDVTLRGDLPIPLAKLTCPVDLDKGWGTTVIANEGTGKTRVWLLPRTGLLRATGALGAGGYIAQMPSLVGYNAFFSAPGQSFRYVVVGSGEAKQPKQIEIGLGQDGQVVKAGTVFRFAFAIGSFADSKGGNDLLEDTVAAMNLAGGTDGYPVTMQAGAYTDGTFFTTLRAEKGEAAATIGPRDLIIDRPFRIEGLQDNGCAAIYTSVRSWFRFVPVVNGAAYFQEPTAGKITLWAGNVFVSDNPAVKLTLVVDGQADGKPPVLELHNPTDKAITTMVTSPPNTPRFGGITERVTVPAGDGIRLTIEGKALVQK